MQRYCEAQLHNFFGGGRGFSSAKLGTWGGIYKIAPSRTPGNSLLQHRINSSVFIGLCAEKKRRSDNPNCLETKKER